MCIVNQEYMSKALSLVSVYIDTEHPLMVSTKFIPGFTYRVLWDTINTYLSVKGVLHSIS